MSEPRLDVRDARADDGDALEAMARELNLGLGWTDSRFTAEIFRRDGLGEERWFDTLVATMDDAHVGYVMLHRSYDTETGRRGAYIMDLYVREVARGSGVGGTLMRAAARRTREWGGTVLWWLTTGDNEVGKTFYAKLAREVTGVEVWIAEEDDFEALLE